MENLAGLRSNDFKSRLVECKSAYPDSKPGINFANEPYHGFHISLRNFFSAGSWTWLAVIKLS